MFRHIYYHKVLRVASFIVKKRAGDAVLRGDIPHANGAYLLAELLFTGNV